MNIERDLKTALIPAFSERGWCLIRGLSAGTATEQYSPPPPPGCHLEALPVSAVYTGRHAFCKHG